MKTHHRQMLNRKTNLGFFDKVNNWLILIFLFLLPTQLGKHFFLPFSYLSGVRVDYLAPTIFLTDIVAVLLIVLNIRKVIKLFTNKWVSVFFLLVAIGGFFAQSPEIFLYRFLKIVELVGIFAVFKYSKLPIKSMFWFFFAGACLELILVVMQFINKQSVQGIFYFFGERYLNLSMPGIAKASLQGVEFLRPYGTFSHPNSLAGFYLLVYTFFRGQKKLPIYLSAVFFLLILFSFSKTALLGFFIVQVFYLKDEFKKSTCYLCVISKVILFSLPLIIFALAKTDPLSLQKRYLLMQNAFELIPKYLLFGTGLGNYLPAQAKFPISSTLFPYQPVHNIFLLLVVETGLLTTLYLAYFGFKKLLTDRKNEVFLACCIALFITGLLDHYWLTLQQNFLLMGVIFGVLASHALKTR